MNSTVTQRSRRLILAVAHSDYPSKALHVDRSKAVVNPWYQVPLGWLRDESARGKIPKPGPPDPRIDDQVELFYGLSDLGISTPATECHALDDALEFRPEPGDEILAITPLTVFNLRHGPSGSEQVRFAGDYFPNLRHVIRFELPDLRLKLESAGGPGSIGYCRAAGRVVPRGASREPLEKSIRQDPAALEAVRRAILANPSAIEEIRKALLDSQRR